MDFNQLNIIPPILKAVAEAGYHKPTEIQAEAIPVILAGEDVLGCAQTGTGKTAAFAIPILQNLEKVSKKNLAVLVLAPTRELALQIEESFNQYGTHLKSRCAAIFGGVSQVPQEKILKQGVEILVATPGRLLDLMQQGVVHLNNINVLVLDEADHMLDMGFIHDVKRIVAQIPKKRQTLLFSATMPKAIRALADTILNQPISIAVAPVSSVAETVDQSLFYVEKTEKTALLISLFKEKTLTRSLIFTRTKHGADRLVKQLKKTNILAAAIHGNKSQNSRQAALNDFKNNKISVLVATDIAARGIDIDELPQVVNYELPNVPETYVHRIGRTGRAGKGGIAISFCDAEQKTELNDIQKMLGFKIPVTKYTIKN